MYLFLHLFATSDLTLQNEERQIYAENTLRVEAEVFGTFNWGYLFTVQSVCPSKGCSQRLENNRKIRCQLQDKISQLKSSFL